FIRSSCFAALFGCCPTFEGRIDSRCAGISGESGSQSMTRCIRNMALAALAALGAAIGMAYGDEPAKPPRANIPWLIAEDMSPDLGCYGAKLVTTPNLDALAASGVRYTRAFTTAPVCSPSRSAFCTGMYQTAIGAHNHRSHRDDGYKLPEGVKV